MRVRTKIRYEDAEQYSGKPVTGICIDENCAWKAAPHVHTMHNAQAVVVQIGDWIFPEPDKGFYYPVKPKAFAKNWEPADSMCELPPETNKVLGALMYEVDPRIVNDIAKVLKEDFAAVKANAEAK